MEFRQHRHIDEKKPTRYYSSKQERTVAKAIGGRTTPNSGATVYEKGDVVVGDKRGWMIECKTCTKDQKSFTMQKAWFDKNIEESIYMKKDHSAVVFNFGPNSKNYYVVDETTFNVMKDLLERFERGEIELNE